MKPYKLTVLCEMVKNKQRTQNTHWNIGLSRAKQVIPPFLTSFVHPGHLKTTVVQCGNVHSVDSTEKLWTKSNIYISWNCYPSIWGKCRSLGHLILVICPVKISKIKNKRPKYLFGQVKVCILRHLRYHKSYPMLFLLVFTTF